MIAAATAVFVPKLHSQHERNVAKSRAAEARLIAAEERRLRRLERPHRGAARALRPAAGASAARQLRARHALLLAAQRSITADARARARAGELVGPISRTECGPLLRAPDAVTDDTVLTKNVGRFDCVAVKSEITQEGRSVGRLGYPFVTALDFKRFTYVWCRNTPAQGERGNALVFVRLQRACLAARGRAMGSGYADVPGS